MVKKKRKQSSIAISRPTKDVLDSIKHPGQSYEGLIKELIKFWQEGKLAGAT